LWTAVIITTYATGPAGDVHDRTPLILPRDRVDSRLDPSRTKPEQIYEVLDGIVLEPLAVRPVSTRVNRVGTAGPDLIEPISEHLDEPVQLTLNARAARTVIAACPGSHGAGWCRGLLMQEMRAAQAHTDLAMVTRVGSDRAGAWRLYVSMPTTTSGRRCVRLATRCRPSRPTSCGGHLGMVGWSWAGLRPVKSSRQIPGPQCLIAARAVDAVRILHRTV
jgi:hypothetical protein